MPFNTDTSALARPDIEGALEEMDLVAARSGFIATRVLPVINTPVKSGDMNVVPVKQLFQQHSTLRSPGAAFKRGAWSYERLSWKCAQYGWEEPLDDSEAEVFGVAQAELISAKRARDFVLRDLEKRVADMVFNAVTWTPSHITNEWDDFTKATPIADVRAASETVKSQTGMPANAVILSEAVFNNALLCDEITDKIKYVQRSLPGDLDDGQLLSMAFGVPYVIVGGGAYNTKGVGQTVVGADIWSNEYVMVARIATGADPKEPCLGRIFHWTALRSTIGCALEEYREEQTQSKVIRAYTFTDEKIFDTKCAVLLDNATT